MPFSPAAKLRRPRAPRKAAPLLPQNADARLLNAAHDAREIGWALLLLLDLGIRRSELNGRPTTGHRSWAPSDHRVRQRPEEPGDPAPRSGRAGDRGLPAWKTLPLLDRLPEPDDFLLYPEGQTHGRPHSTTRGRRSRRRATALHRWWYRPGFEDAGLVGRERDAPGSTCTGRRTHSPPRCPPRVQGHRGCRAHIRSVILIRRRRSPCTAAMGAGGPGACDGSLRPRALPKNIILGRESKCSPSPACLESLMVEPISGGGGNRTRARFQSPRDGTVACASVQECRLEHLGSHARRARWRFRRRGSLPSAVVRARTSVPMANPERRGASQTVSTSPLAVSGA